MAAPMTEDDDAYLRPTGPHSNRLGADYGRPGASRPLIHGAPTDYSIKRGVDPRGFYDLDNLHTPSAPPLADCCDLTPFIID